MCTVSSTHIHTCMLHVQGISDDENNNGTDDDIQPAKTKKGNGKNKKKEQKVYFACVQMHGCVHA